MGVLLVLFYDMPTHKLQNYNLPFKSVQWNEICVLKTL
jgi:hypothetical protein